MDDDDFGFVVGDIRLPVPKKLLIEKSHVFEAMFESGMSESTSNEMIIFDFSADVVSDCILYMRVNLVETSLMRNPKELLAFANKYQILSIIRLVEKYLHTNLSLDNVISILQFADVHARIPLKNAAFRFISENSEFLLTLPGFSKSLGYDLCDELFSFLESKLKTSTLKSLTESSDPSVTKIIISGSINPHVNGEYFFFNFYHTAGYYEKYYINDDGDTVNYVIFKDFKVHFGDVCWAIMLQDELYESFSNGNCSGSTEYRAVTNMTSRVPTSDLVWIDESDDEITDIVSELCSNS
jgi:hypothetical protein